MKFTVIFDSHESVDLSYGLVFVPCPVWAKGEKILINLNPESPCYQLGSIKKLLKAEKFEDKIISKQCLVVVYNSGHAQKRDLETLLQDLNQEGFQVKQATIG